MCYHCATNPSIHHCCHRVAAISSPLSHHGVTFTVTSSWFRRCHYNVAFIVTLLQCRCRSRVIVVPSLSHCCSFVVAIMVSPSSLHCCGFVVAVVVSPSHLSRFCCHCCGVAFVSVAVLSSLSRCCLRHRIVTVSSSSRCCLHRRIVVVLSSRFHRRHRRVAFIVTLSWCSLPFIITVVVSPLSLHRHGVVIVVLLSLLQCHF